MTYNIKQAAQQTGISAYTIRAWEKRYAVVKPQRTDTNRRLYSEDEIERLCLVANAVASGHAISRVASLSSIELNKMASSADRVHLQESNPVLKLAVKAVEEMNSECLDLLLSRAVATLGLSATLESVVIPLLAIIGRRWVQGTIRIGQEHLASNVIRGFLERTRLSISPKDPAPRLLVATPAGQMHELGALIVSVYASLFDWQVVYLGVNLPSQDIADAARTAGVLAIGLSVIHPSHDPMLSIELQELRSAVGSKMPILVGGRSPSSYEKTLRSIRARSLSDLRDFGSVLNRILIR